ncbi:Major facilitator superfamily transporter [Pleurostoma richardsiae]|uniref:Major facilitator superfamily transporter n=1 Tax=Pleurostoma richardsiae TaxID=41990 RepID=A0AA38RKM5_9PEZI|nr:Major facilitator superfamily transporter [Pleurostoma richardsiae]
MSEKDIERDAADMADETSSVTKTEQDDEEYEPIRSRAPSRPRTPRSRSLSLVRSNNGYGCDDLEEADIPDAQQGEKDPYEVGWENGDEDPANPRSMSSFRKWLIVAVTSFGSFCVTCASSIYTSTYKQMDAEFGNSRIVATLGLSLFVLGIAFGPMWSPLSEFYGRRPIYIIAFAVFTIWIIPTAVAKNIETVIISRFFQGFTGSAFLSVAGGTVGDLFTRQEMAAPMTIFTIAPFIGPSVGPLIGGLINTWTDWRWTHYTLIIWGFCLLIAIIVLVPETYHPVLLRNKARKLRKETGDERWKAPIEKSNKSILRTVGLALLRPFQILIFEPMALNLNLLSAILLGVLYLFFGAFPLVFEHNHGFNLWQVGLTFLGMFIGNIIAALTAPIWFRIRERLIEKNEKETGIPGKSEPEFRLPSVIAGAILVPIGLFWFGWTTYSSVHWIVPIIGSAVFGAGTLLVFNGVFTFLVDAYPLYAASALAANAFVRCSFAAAFPLFGVQMYNRLGYQWATSLLAFLTVAMMPFPYIFFRYGKKIRAKSRMATTD